MIPDSESAAEIAAPKRARAPRQISLLPVTRPIVKSVGGKGRLLPILCAHLPLSFGRYFEPFCGGAALFFDLIARGQISGNAALGDLNVDLIETYSALAFDVETVIRHLHEHAARHREDGKRHYYFMRELWNDQAVEMGTCERAAVYLYLNKTCFNGLWRVNKSGGFNVPLGRYVNPTICNPPALRAAAAALSKASILAGDYRMTCGPAARGDLVFMDPPYDGDTFTSYTSAKFDAEAQGELAQFARVLAKRGVHVLLSNHDTALIRELYPTSDGWHVYEISAPRSVAASGSKRAPARELLISSYEKPEEGN